MHASSKWKRRPSRPPTSPGEIEGIVAALKSAASAENLVKLASELPAEIANIARAASSTRATIRLRSGVRRWSRKPKKEW